MMCGNCEQCGVFTEVHETDIRPGWYCAECTVNIITHYFETTTPRTDPPVSVDPNQVVNT